MSMIIRKNGAWDRENIRITDLEKYSLCLNHRVFYFGEWGVVTCGRWVGDRWEMVIMEGMVNRQEDKNGEWETVKECRC